MVGVKWRRAGSPAPNLLIWDRHGQGRGAGNEPELVRHLTVQVARRDLIGGQGAFAQIPRRCLAVKRMAGLAEAKCLNQIRGHETLILGSWQIQKLSIG